MSRSTPAVPGFPRLDDDVDLARERLADPTVMTRRRGPSRFVAPLVVTLCFATGIALGFFLAASRAPRPAVEGGAPASQMWGAGAVTPEVERVVANRLAILAADEAQANVRTAVGEGDRLLSALSLPASPDEFPVRIEASTGEVQVRMDGDAVEPMAEDVYRVRRDHPIQVEVTPVPQAPGQPQSLDIIITPLLELEQYDPYAPPRHRR
jgi:hypothetical protein